jgi:hypothetical protein
MPVTYSINVGQIIEATRKPDIFSVLQDLPDNTQKLISPRDVRDAFLSVWANSSIKVTSPGNISGQEYIGVDSGNPNGRDIKKKILLGKRSYGNLDVMNLNLLNSDTDIFFYNTKPDNVTQSSTKIGILAGTNSTLFSYAPYIESQSTTSSSINFNIHNPSLGGGPISIYSDSGRVAINGIQFPTIAESLGSASNGKILRYYGTFPNGVLKWDDSFTSLTEIGTPGFTTSIYGTPVLLNGYPLEFYDDNFVPQTIGGITQGSSFPQNSFSASGFVTPGSGQNWPLTEILRKMLYPYIEPQLSIIAENTLSNNTYAEAGYSQNFSLTFSFTTYARESSESISDYFISEFGSTNSIVYQGTSFSAPPGTSFSANVLYSTTSQLPIPLDFVLSLSTVQGVSLAGYPFGYSFSATASIQFVNPIFLGYDSSSSITTTPALASLFASSAKLVVPDPGSGNSVKLAINGSGYLYFAHPSSYITDVQQIKDPNGFLIYDSSNPGVSVWNPSYVVISSPLPYSNTTSYKLWKMTLPTSYSAGGEFEFIF